MNVMNTPFTIEFSVKEINANPDTPILGVSTYSVRVTLRHYIRDILHQIWVKSPDFRLKPMFLRILRDGNSVPDQQLFDILNTDIPPESSVTDFELVIDYTLFGNRSIPTRDPVEELFDIVIEWNDTSGRTHNIQIRESLSCTIAVLKDYVAEARNRTVEDGEYVDGSYFNLRYWPNDDLCDNSAVLADVIGLDLIPFSPVLFELSYNFDRFETTSTATNIRFFIRVFSEIETLQHEASLFEINQRTTVREFINRIIERMDHYQVRRTFFDQVKLKYNDLDITAQPNLDATVYEVLNLTQGFLNDNRNIISMNLMIHQHLSGVEGGILSREFLNDLRANNRFEFLPRNYDDDLAIVNRAENDLTVTGSGPIEVQNHNFEPTRIVLADGAEWTLTGETYEMIEINPTSVGHSTTASTSKQLLVNQSDLSSIEYQFSLKINDNEINVSLNSSQCIIVDSTEHPPYVLLSPAGIAKLNRHFKDNGHSIIQQVKIHTYNPAENNSIPTPTPTFVPPEDFNINRENRAVPDPEPIPEQVNFQPIRPRDINGLQLIRWIFRYLTSRNRGFYGNLMKIILVVLFLGIDEVIYSQPKIILFVLWFFFVYAIFWRSLWTADFIRRNFLTPEQVHWYGATYGAFFNNIVNKLTRLGNYRQLKINSLQYRLVRYSVNRPRDYELLILQLNKQIDWKFKLQYNIQNAIKNTVLLLITFIPSFEPKIQNELNRWRSNENNDLKADIQRLNDKFLNLKRAYEAKFNRTLPWGFDIASITNYILEEGNVQEEYEIQYQIFLDQYIMLQGLYNTCMLEYQQPVNAVQPAQNEPAEHTPADQRPVHDSPVIEQPVHNSIPGSIPEQEINQE